MRRQLFCVVVLASLLVPASAFAKAKQYQVTGQVTELTDDTITVMKGKEKFEIGRDKDTKVDGDLKVGEKVTVYYTMSAASVEVRSEKK
jgi:hypothetical protein